MWMYCIFQNGCCCCSIQSCLTLCDPMDCSTPGFPVLQYLPEFAQMNAHWICDVILTISSSATPFFFCLQSFPSSRSLRISRLFPAGGPNIGASVSVLSKSIQDWFPLGLIDLISFMSRVFSRTTIQDGYSSNFYIVCKKVNLLSCVRLCDPMDCSPPVFSIHGIFQAWVLQWVAISFCRGSSRPRN